MKLYTFTMKRSLPRLALKGMPPGFWFQESLPAVVEWASMDETEGDPAVILEVDTAGIEDSFGLEGEVVEDMAAMAREDAPDDESGGSGEATEQAYFKVYDRAEEIMNTLRGEPFVRALLDGFEGAHNMAEVPASKVTVLSVEEMEWPEEGGQAPKITFSAPPKPLKAFKQPLVTRLLRSIFLPQHKLYGAGKPRQATMGFLSKFFPRGEDVEEAPPPDVVSGTPLVWAAGKTFDRGMKGAFGEGAGDAISQLVVMRVDGKPGKLLGSGAKGAVYALGSDRVLKVTMDGNEVQAAANLLGVKHPNLSFVHDAFIVSDGEKGVGIIVRDPVDTTLDRYNKEVAKALDEIMDEVLASAQAHVGSDAVRIQDIDPKDLATEMDGMIALLREDGCDSEATALLDLADAFRALRYYGILGIDFDSKNIGVIKKPKPRPIIFDYGMTQSPPVEVQVVSLESART